MPLTPVDASRVAIVADDDEFYRLAVSALLTRHHGFGRVIETGSLDEALARLADTPEATLALFDLRMPGMASAASVTAVRECFPLVKTAIVSASTDRADILLALDAGAHGYIPKTFNAAEIVVALRHLLDGLIFVPTLLAEAPRLDAARPIACAKTKELSDEDLGLTRRQLDVLKLIVIGMSNKEIARTLDLSEGTVKVHVAALLRTLGVANRAAAAVAGLQVLKRRDAA